MVYYSVSRYNEDMFVAGIMSWWYGNGLRLRLGMIGSRVARTSDYFSIGLLASTLFSPYRQISAGKVSGPPSLQLRAFGDRLISRLIAAIVRTFMTVLGVVVTSVQAISGAVVVFCWLLLPLFPVVGLRRAMIGGVRAGR